MVDNNTPEVFSQDFSSLPREELDQYFENLDFPSAVDLSYRDKPPVLDEVETDHKFEVTLPGDCSGKSTWVYSAALKKVFIKILTPFTITVNYQNPEIYQNPGNLYLRVIPVFTEPEHHHNPVNRCKHHSSATDHHILECKNNTARFEGDQTGTDYGKRLCVVMPLDSKARDVSENVTLLFHCQNSCATGINRRTTALIFVLETERQEIVGKRLLYFKVCSCPKRDQQKEEEIAHPKRKAEHQLAPPGKRPCKIIRKEIKQEYPTPSQTPSFSPMSMTEESATNTISYTLNVANQEALVRILQSAADIHGVMALESNDNQHNQHCLGVRESLLQQKTALERLVQIEQFQDTQQVFQPQDNFMQ